MTNPKWKLSRDRGAIRTRLGAIESAEARDARHTVGTAIADGSFNARLDGGDVNLIRAVELTDGTEISTGGPGGVRRGPREKFMYIATRDATLRDPRDGQTFTVRAGKTRLDPSHPALRGPNKRHFRRVDVVARARRRQKERERAEARQRKPRGRSRRI